MPKVSIIILTKNRVELFKKALASVEAQNFSDYEIVAVNDGSADATEAYLEDQKNWNPKLTVIHHKTSLGIIKSRQEAIERSMGEYVAFLDDDDEWIDRDKLKKQTEFLDKHPECVLVGGGIKIISNSEFLISKQIPNSKSQINKLRPLSDSAIRNTMLFRNNFFTSTVMVKKQAVLKAGGFLADGQDFVEDYDLWLRLGRVGEMYNFPQVFTRYSQPPYNKEKFKNYLKKQLALIGRHRRDYPYYWLASSLLRLRIILKY